MAENVINTRIQLKNDTETNWELTPNFVPKLGEAIIYNTDTNNTKPRIKIGDGSTTIANLPFITAEITYNSFTGNPTANQTPSFGDTVTISQILQSTSGQVSGTNRTITIPNTLVSSTSAGLAPQGTAVSTQSQTTKFLREDGSWAAPSYSSGGTDENVKQEKTSSSDSNTYELLFASTSTDATVTSYAKKYYGLSFTPSTGVLYAGKFNGLTLTSASTGFTIAGGTTSKTLTVGSDYTLAAACAKAVDTSISAGSSSVNLPTSAAVATFVEGKGYKTTDANVTQTATTTSAAYELLFSNTADNTTRTEGTRKTSTLTYNPSTKALATGGSVNGLTLTAATTGFTIAGGTTSKTLTVSETYTLAAACAKSVDSSVSSSSSNLPTSAAVYSYVNSAMPSFTAITSAEIDAIVV